MSTMRMRTAATVVALTGLVVHLVRFLSLPLAAKLSYLPDDAFYYLQLGREFQRSHVWSLDRGRTVTSGFHVLFGYVCALVERLVPGEASAHLRVMLLSTLGVVLTAAALLLLVRTTARELDRGSAVAMLLVGACGGMSMLAIQIMEWPFAVLVSSVVFFSYATQRWALLYGALVLAPLCRTDLALLGGCLALGHLSVEGARDPGARRRLASVAAATAVGVALVILHTRVITGEWIQTSARVKSFWGSVMGYHLGYGIEPASYAFTPAFLLTRVLDFGTGTLAVPVALLAIGYLVAWPELRHESANAKVTRRTATLALAGYAVAYGRLGNAAQCWYAANFVAPLFVLCASIASALPSRAVTGVLAVSGVLVIITAWDARRPIWNAATSYALTQTFRNGAELVPVAAAWNAGRTAYFGGERIVNIDGLVNDDVLPYLERGAIHCYLVHERIPFIADDPKWPTREHGRYLGFPKGQLLEAMVPFNAFPSGPFVWRVDLARLAADPECATDRRSARSRGARPFP